MTAAANTEVYLPGIILQQADTALAEQNVDDGSNGVDSVRFGAGSFALNSVPGPGVNSTGVAGIDYGSQVAQVVRQQSPGSGQGSMPVGFSTATSDDVAAIYLAVRQAVPTVTVTVTPGNLGLTTPGAGYSDIYGDVYGGGLPVTTSLAVTPGAVTLAGSVIATQTKVAVTPGAVTLTGKAIALSIAGGGVVTINVTIPAAVVWDDLIALWSDPTVAWDTASGTSLTLSGRALTVSTTAAVTVGAITLTGQAIATSRTTAVTPGAITATGQDVAVFTEGGSVTLAPDPGAITFTGAEAALSFTVPVTAGAVTLTGTVVAVRRRVLILTSGAITFVGQIVVTPEFEDDQGEDEDEDVQNISHAGTGKIRSPEEPGLHQRRVEVGLTR